MSSTFLISDAAKQVSVEAHVLRYWEEELKLPIKRNELGHRYYTEEDIRRFMEIKDLKERGLQLKAIRMVLKNGKLDRLTPVEEEKNITQIADAEKEVLKEEKSQIKELESSLDEPEADTQSDTLQVISTGQALRTENGEDKIKRLQWLLQQMFREVVQENNATLCREMKESVLKELDYQFRMQEEKEEERNAQKIKRDEEHYKKIDELLRKKRRLFKK
ncbi:MAG: MerR family transcriptional regulator [Lachnospiraceae bacterium]|nr:MerR family transcriptional regulator [Lachnospiraceae bacterium]